MYFIVLSINIYAAYQFAKCVIIVAVKDIGALKLSELYNVM